MPATTLTVRQLNRALLARQMLLKREKIPVLRAVERQVAMQAQLARPPFVGLWSRIENFRREELIRLVHQRKVVRATMMRATLHVMTAKDFSTLRAAIQPALTKAMQSALRDRSTDLDVDGAVNAARAFFDEQPRTFDAFREHLESIHRDEDIRALAYAVRTRLPLVQIPSDAAWGYPGSADFGVAETWLGAPLDVMENRAALILKYLAAFGPATPADAQNWSGLPSLRDAFEALRPKLHVFHDERGRELFDVPNAPRPDAKTLAPVRFIPEFDNLVLGHAERQRIVPDAHRKKIFTANLQIPATVLVDGFVAGTWKIERKKTAATVVIKPFESFTPSVRDALTEEAKRVAAFVEPDAAAIVVEFSTPA